MHLTDSLQIEISIKVCTWLISWAASSIYSKSFLASQRTALALVLLSYRRKIEGECVCNSAREELLTSGIPLVPRVVPPTAAAMIRHFLDICPFLCWRGNVLPLILSFNILGLRLTHSATLLGIYFMSNQPEILLGLVTRSFFRSHVNWEKLNSRSRASQVNKNHV